MLTFNDNRKIIIHINFDYFTLPILLRTYIGKKHLFFTNAGPYVGYLIKQTDVDKGSNINTVTVDNTSYTQRLDAGFTIGLGVTIPIKKSFLFTFEIRNNLGLYNVSKGAMADDKGVKTNSTNFLLGFAHKFGIQTESKTENEKDN